MDLTRLWDGLAPVATALGHSALGLWLGKSTARIATLLSLHLLGLTLLGGSVFVSSLRLLGILQRDRPVAAVARDVRPVLTIGLAVMLITGSLIFTGGAVEYFGTPWFRTKMELLLVALTFHFACYRRVMAAEEGRFSDRVRRLTGAVTLILWLSVGFAGKAIAYF